MGTAREEVMKVRKPRWVCPNGCKITRVKATWAGSISIDSYHKVTDLECESPTSESRMYGAVFEDGISYVSCPKCDSIAKQFDRCESCDEIKECAYDGECVDCWSGTA